MRQFLYASQSNISENAKEIKEFKNKYENDDPRSNNILAENVYVDTYRKAGKNNHICLLDNAEGIKNFYLANIMQANQNYVITETGPDATLYFQTKDFLKEQGYKVYLLDFTNVYQNNCTYNFFSQARDEKDIRYICQNCVSQSGDPFYVKALECLMMAIIRYLQYNNQEINFTNIVKIMRLADKTLPNPTEPLDSILLHTSPSIRKDYLCWKMGSGKAIMHNLLQNITELQTYFTSFEKLNEKKEEFKLESLLKEKEKVAVFLRTYDASSDIPLTLFYSSLCNMLIQEYGNINGRQKIPKILIGTSAPIKNLLIAMILSEKSDTSFVLAYPNLSPLKKQFHKDDEWESIVDLCSTMILAPTDELLTASFFANKCNDALGIGRTSHEEFIYQCYTNDIFVKISNEMPIKSNKYNVSKHLNYKRLNLTKTLKIDNP